MNRITVLILLIVTLGCKNSNNSDVLISEDIRAKDNNAVAANYSIDSFTELITDKKNDLAKVVIDSLGANFKDEYGRNLFDQSINQDISIVYYLLEKGYELTVNNSNSLFNVSKKDTNQFKNLFLKYTEDNNYLLKKVILSCDVDLLNIVIRERGLDYSDKYKIKDKHHYACSLILCDSTSVDMLRVLLNAGMEISEKENHCLIEHNLDEGIPQFAKVDFLQELIEKGYLRESKEWSPFVSLCYWSENSLVKYFLERGYSPNRNSSADLLYFAITRPGDGFGEHLNLDLRLQTVELLLSYGADPNLLIAEDWGNGKNSMSFVQFAKQWKFEDNSELLELLGKYTR